MPRVLVAMDTYDEVSYEDEQQENLLKKPQKGSRNAIIKSKSLQSPAQKICTRCYSLTNLKKPRPRSDELDRTLYLLQAASKRYCSDVLLRTRSSEQILVRSKSCDITLSSCDDDYDSDEFGSFHYKQRPQSTDISGWVSQSATLVTIAVANPDIAQSFLELNERQNSDGLVGSGEQKGCVVPNWMKNVVLYAIVFAFFIFALSRIEYPR